MNNREFEVVASSYRHHPPNLRNLEDYKIHNKISFMIRLKINNQWNRSDQKNPKQNAINFRKCVPFNSRQTPMLRNETGEMKHTPLL